MIFYNRLSSSGFALLVSLSFAFLGFLLFHQRSPDALSLLNILTFDAQMYLNMTNGIEVPGPHSCRILMPYLAKAFQFNSLQSIFTINIISFVILFYGLVKMLEIFVINRSAILYSLTIFFSTYSLAYNFSNPYLVDLPALATITLFIYSIIKHRFITSLFWFISSLLFRETAIVLIPLFFFTFSSKKAIFVSILSILVYSIPKLIISGDIYCNFKSSFNFSLLFDFEFMIKIILSYGPVWFLGFIGLINLKNYKNNLKKIISILFILSLIGSVLSSFKSVTDITRMCFLMLPILVLGSAMLINNIFLQKHSSLYLVIISISGLFASIGYFPNIFIQAEFNSLKEFAISNNIIIVSNLFVQSIFIFIIIKKFLIKSFYYGTRS